MPSLKSSVHRKVKTCSKRFRFPCRRLLCDVSLGSSIFRVGQVQRSLPCLVVGVFSVCTSVYGGGSLGSVLSFKVLSELPACGLANRVVRGRTMFQFVGSIALFWAVSALKHSVF